MQNARAFVDAGWDFVGETRNGAADIWQMSPKGGYPGLRIFSAEYLPTELMGAGTPSDPYRIRNARELGMIGHYNPSACYRLTADLELSGITWTAAPIVDFNGVFDGAGHAVSRLTVRGGDFSALFGRLGGHAVVENLVIRDANIVGDDGVSCIGILAGASNGSITGCQIAGRVSAENKSHAVGGVVGQIGGGVISDCRAICSVSVGQEAYQLGGIVGFSLSGEIIRCCATANVSGAGENRSVGGLVGEAHFWTVVSDCYATGSVLAGRKSSGLGGLVGVVSEGDVFPTSGKIANCYAAGVVRAGEDSTDVGGLLGQEAKVQPLTNNCYFLQVSDGGRPDNKHGIPLLDDQMKQRASFPGWDFDSIWTISEGKSYPRLRWEESQGSN
jgi:hypothetical protein